MRIDGEWLEEFDGVIRPILNVTIQGLDGLVTTEFLIDTGADHTVIHARILEKLGVSTIPSLTQLSGVGGTAETVKVFAKLLLPKSDGTALPINLECYGFTDINALETCVLGRDVLNLFAVIFDYRQRIVCLLAPNHSFAIIDPKMP